MPTLVSELDIGYEAKRDARKNRAIIPWTAEREAALELAALQIGKIRDTVDAALRDADRFAKVLDVSGLKLLGEGIAKELK